MGNPNTGSFEDLLKASSPTLASPSMQDNVAPGRPVADFVQQADQQPDIGGLAGTSMKPSDPMHDVKMSREDYAVVREKLEKAGVSKAKLEELDRKVQSPEGLTWGQMMHAARESVIERSLKPVKLTDADKAEVSSLLTKIGFGPDEAGKLLQTMQSGKPAKAFEAIAAKLSSLEPGQTVSLSKDEMGALAKALKLPDSATQRLMAGFAGKDSLELTAEGMKQAFSAVQDELGKALGSIRDAMKGIKDALAPQKDKAAKRLNVEHEALDARVQSDQVKPSALLKEPVNAPVGHDDKPQPKGQQDSGHQPGDPALAKDGRGRDQQPSARNPSQDAKDQPGKAWGDFASKIKVEGGTQTSTSGDARFASLQDMASRLSGQTQGQGQAPGTGQTVRNAQVMSQVESGILKNLGQGVRQLNLELTPESMGRLNVMLTVKGKDVQAVIKAESPEAEKALTENLQQIKQNLENQGLTVSKLEVRAGLSQDSSLGQQWAGADKHNQSQERREALDRMRANSLLAGGGDSPDLAQAVQNRGAEVKNSQGGLSIIA